MLMEMESFYFQMQARTHACTHTQPNSSNYEKTLEENKEADRAASKKERRERRQTAK